MRIQNDQFLLNNPTYGDFTESNFYLSGSTIHVETIPQYLSRIKKQVRKIGKSVTILNEYGTYPINTFINTNFTYKKYEFIGGVDDVDFTEITHNLTGSDIVTLLSGLSITEMLKSTHVEYRNNTVKNVLDDLLGLTVGTITINNIYYQSTLNEITYELSVSGSTYSTGKTVNGVASFDVPYNTYSLKINVPAGYTIQNFYVNTIEVTENVTRNTIPNIVIDSNTNAVIDLNFVVNFQPTLNYISINNGDQYSSTPYLSVYINSSEVVEEYMISENPDFIGASWTTYTGSTIQYYKDFISEITLTLYVKLRNQLGVSEIASDSIILTYGIRRSDSDKKYADIISAFEDVYLDYGGVLNRNVRIYCIGYVYNKRITDKYLLTISNFNKNSQYVLHIDGSNFLTIDCASLGGIKILNSDNIIIDNINFINTGGKLTVAAPEELGGVCVQGNGTFPCDNMVVRNCTINCVETNGVTTNYGDYGIICADTPNVTIYNNSIIGPRATLIKCSFIDNANIVKNTFVGNQVDNVIGHPAHITFSNCNYVNITDNDFDGNSSYDSAIICNATNITFKRNKVHHFNGQALVIQNSSPGDTLHLESNLFYKNLQEPPFPWEHANLYLSNSFQNLNIISNTIHLTGDKTSTFQEFFCTAYQTSINKLTYTNNIVIFDYPNYNTSVTNSTNGSVFNFGSCVLNEYDSKNNFYFDTTNSSTLLNNYIITTATNSPVLIRYVKDLTKYRQSGYEINSTVLGNYSSYFTNVSNFDYSLKALGGVTFVSVTGTCSPIDIEYYSGSTTSGCYGFNYTQIDETDLGFDYTIKRLSDNSGWTSNEQAVLYSTEEIFFNIQSNNRIDVFQILFYNADDPTIKKFILGKNGLLSLTSNLNQSGNYVSDASYNINITRY